jgi:hypothetical protein
MRKVCTRLSRILTFPDVRTEMCSFHISCNTLSCFICVDVHSVQELANIVQWLKILYFQLVNALKMVQCSNHTSRSLGEVIASETASIVCLAVAKAISDYNMDGLVIS